ncbi:hypothetical protein D3C76_1012840 [compost metagenome]
MNKEEALDNYIEHEIIERSKELYSVVMEYFILQRQEVVDGFVNSFQKCCRDIKESQIQNEEKVTVSYIQYSLLISNVLWNKPAYLVEAFDQDYYVGKPLGQYAYDPKWMSDPLRNFYVDIQQAAKKYMLRISPIEVESIFLTELKKHEKVMKVLAKEAIDTLIDTDEYQELHYEHEVQFRIGEYRGATDLIFTKNERNDELWRYVRGVLSNQAR